MNSTSGDDWVEFEDSLGRTRKCMKKDLETFKALDQEFRPKERWLTMSILRVKIVTDKLPLPL